jgi:hypothetical protein
MPFSNIIRAENGEAWRAEGLETACKSMASCHCSSAGAVSVNFQVINLLGNLEISESMGEDVHRRHNGIVQKASIPSFFYKFPFACRCPGTQSDDSRGCP